MVSSCKPARANGSGIRFRGRSGERINVGGEKVSPDAVEQVLLELDFIREAVVSGESNAMMGQVVTAKAVLNGSIDGRDAFRRIRVHCRSRMAPHMVPVRIDFVSGSLRTARHKAQRALCT